MGKKYTPAPKTDSDKRSSARRRQDLQTAEQLSRENEKFREDVEQLKEMLKVFQVPLELR